MQSWYYGVMTSKRQFLEDHNSLAPLDLQATTATLSRFRVEKKALFKTNDWSTDKLRRPFIMWLTAFSVKEREDMK